MGAGKHTLYLNLLSKGKFTITSNLSLEIGKYYEVKLSDDSTKICKCSQYIDNLPVFKTIDNRFLYYDGCKNEFPNRYKDFKEIEDQTKYRREDILSNLLG